MIQHVFEFDHESEMKFIVLVLDSGGIENMVIGLLGFSFEDRNKGCEALTYSFVEVLCKTIKEKLIIINLSGIGEADEIRKRYPNIVFESVGFQRNKICLNSFKALNRCDVIFDCTFGDNFSDLYSRDFVKKTMLLKELCFFFNKRLVLAPQTIGPFYDKRLEKRAAKIIKKCDIVFSRDKRSSDYVRIISGVNAITTTDLAFLLPFDNIEKNSNILRIGINISGLLWKGGFSSNNQFELTVNYQEYIHSLIQALCKNRDYEIHLIPHVMVLDKEEIDNDYYVCEELSKQYHITFSGFFSTPIEAKNYISKMDVFTGSRMHSTIGAFSSGVITIPFSYSRKFEGLFETIGYPFLIDGKRLNTIEAVNKTMEYIEDRVKLSKSQTQALMEAEKYERLFTLKIKEYFSTLYNQPYRGN